MNNCKPSGYIETNSKELIIKLDKAIEKYDKLIEAQRNQEIENERKLLLDYMNSRSKIKSKCSYFFWWFGLGWLYYVVFWPKSYFPWKSSTPQQPWYMTSEEIHIQWYRDQIRALNRVRNGLDPNIEEKVFITFDIMAKINYHE